jgi:hypothetical protein
VFGPAPIEFSPLFISQFERVLTLGLRKALPKGELRSIPGGEPKELGQWAGCHALIVSRVDNASQYPEIPLVLVFGNSRDSSFCVQRSNGLGLTRGRRPPSSRITPVGARPPTGL